MRKTLKCTGTKDWKGDSEECRESHHSHAKSVNLAHLVSMNLFDLQPIIIYTYKSLTEVYVHTACSRCSPLITPATSASSFPTHPEPAFPTAQPQQA